MGKSSGSYQAPVYKAPTYSAPEYKGPTEGEQQARLDALRTQWDKEASLDKAINVAEVKRDKLEDTKEEIDSRKGVDDVLTNRQKGYKRAPKQEDEESLFLEGIL